MEAVDLVILGILALGGVWGLSAGLQGVFAPLALLVSIVATASLYPYILGLFQNIGNNDVAVRFFAVLLALVMGIMFLATMNRIFAAVITGGRLDGVSRLLGGIIGIALGAVLLGGAVYLAQEFGETQTKTALAGSQLAPIVREFFHIFMSFAEHFLPSLKKGS